MCILCASSPTVAWHQIVSTELQPQQMGTVQGGTSNGSSTFVNNNLVDQINSDTPWRTSGGAIASTITFGIPTSNSYASGYTEQGGWSQLNVAQATAVRQAIGLWDEIIKQDITESSNPNAADIKIANTTTGVSFAHAYYPGTVGAESSSYDKIAGSVWLSGTSATLQNPSVGTYGFTSLLHELGHALGLSHAGNYNGGSPAYGNTSSGWLFTEDSRQYTVMSYFQASSTGANWFGGNAQTPMVYDILAIQQLYGADNNTRSGNTVYGFNANTANSLYNFNQNTNPILTIWDGAGIDTIDLTNWATDSFLSLVAGAYSNVNGMTKNLAIAFDVDIENAKTGAGNDTITGNDIDNVLSSGGGNDTVSGAGGDDTLTGGGGSDILLGGAGNDTIYFDSLDNLAQLSGGTGIDTLIQSGFHTDFDFAGHGFEHMKSVYVDNSGAAWQNRTDSYDTSNRLFKSDTLFDDSTRVVTEYDVAGSQSWSERVTTYGANGSVISVVTTPDGGGTGGGGTPTNAAPVITSTASVSMPENRAAVTTVAASDSNGDALTYSISGGADAALFKINSATGALSFVNAPDFEVKADADGNNVYLVKVRVSDGSLTDEQSISVTVTDVNENVVNAAPVFTSQSLVTIPENRLTAVDVNATDANGDKLTYTIAGGVDAARFRIDAATGLLKFKTAPNYEAPNDSNGDRDYIVIVRASDGKATSDQQIKIVITDVLEPVRSNKINIVSNGAGETAALTVLENHRTVSTVKAQVIDSNNLPVYTISGGADAAKFSINASTGVLSLRNGANFEKPADADRDGIYKVTIKATSGGLFDTQSLSVKVLNTNEAPRITSNGGKTFAVDSVIEGEQLVTYVKAFDPDAGSLVSYKIIGGADAGKFVIGPTSGALILRNPANHIINGDNTYLVKVRATDGTRYDDQWITVTIKPDVTPQGTIADEKAFSMLHEPSLPGVYAHDDWLFS